MRALQLIEDRRLETVEVAPPPAPGLGEVTLRIKAVALNHIDVWGWRGMAFAKRKLPLVVGVEAAGEVAAVGADVTTVKVGDKVVGYGGLTCGICKACRAVLHQQVAELELVLGPGVLEPAVHRAWHLH